MQNYTEFLLEKAQGKNLHLEHLEDEIYNNGIEGVRGSIKFLQSLRDMLKGHSRSHHVNVTVKWDGAPAIFAGVNPDNGKFFVGTKSVFTKNAKLNYTDKDIDENHSASGLNSKLKVALKYLPELDIHGVIQGDMMFTHDDLKHETIEGNKYVTFQPNTITYAIPEGSDLARTIKSAKMGVVWHTTYAGKTLEDMRASFHVNVGSMKSSRNVWYQDATFVDDSGAATFTQSESDEMSSVLSKIGRTFHKLNPRFVNKMAANESMQIEVKAWNNIKVREGQEISNTQAHAKGFIKHIGAKMDKHTQSAKREDTIQNRDKAKKKLVRFFTTNVKQLELVYDMMNLIIEAKLLVIKKLREVNSIGTFIRTADGFRVTHPEGFVAIDKFEGNAIKLVDRLSFSHDNFNVEKNWSK
jgi:hypothetical protein